MINSKIEDYLNARMGLDAASIGRVAVERALRTRLAVCGLDADAYWEHVRASELETQELIEAIVVPETWFFRDRNAFDALSGAVLPGLRKSQPERVLHILSLPCATGEEPFSIAMALLDAGFAAGGFQIDACDISLRAIAFAQAATYGRNSFRGHELGFRARYFEQTASGHRLCDDIRRKVRFFQANVLLDSSFAIGRQYDVIFCRNMLIYFDRRNQQRAVQALARLLAPQGTLFIGGSESAPLLHHGFVSARLPGACAFRKAARTAVPKGGARIAQSAVAVPPSTVSPPPGRTRPTGNTAGSSAAAGPWAWVATAGSAGTVAADHNWIAAAQQLADRGKLTEAMQLCDRNLNATGPCAQAFYLKALLHDACGQSTQAIAHYRKALYLDPSHQDALVHLGAALLKEGDTSSAQHLFDRAERLTRSGGG
jgi:chemotaxis protein methyltransferase WspC